MLCSVILQNVNFALDDPNNTKFSLTQKILAINSALQALVSYRPDAASYTTMMLLVAGTRQTLPSDGVRLLKVIRNRGQSGLSDAGRAIRKADMLVQDALILIGMKRQDKQWLMSIFTIQLPLKIFMFTRLRQYLRLLVSILAMFVYYQQSPQTQMRFLLMIILPLLFKSGCFTCCGAVMISKIKIMQMLALI